jgi:hypothetical protein
MKPATILKNSLDIYRSNVCDEAANIHRDEISHISRSIFVERCKESILYDPKLSHPHQTRKNSFTDTMGFYLSNLYDQYRENQNKELMRIADEDYQNRW